MSYKKNILTLIMGNTFAQAIPIAISPLLTRIYTPEDFGVFGVYIAIIAILASFSNGQYHIAIVLPVSNEKAINLAILSFFITLALTIFLFLFIYIFYDSLISLSNNSDISTVLFFIPISIFLIGIYNIYTYLNTRNKAYKKISTSEIIKALSSSFIQLLLGLINKNLIFLILGNIGGFVISILYFFFNFKNKVKTIKKVNLICVMKKYVEYPKINIFNNLLYNLSQYVIHLFITSIYEIKYVGFYTLVQRVMLIPTSIIGRAISQVFFQHMRDSIKINTAKQKFNETLIMLIFVSSIIFLFLFFYIKDIFIFIFGEDWKDAGNIAKLLIPLFFTQFIRSSINTVTMLYQKQKEQMIINLVMLLILLIIFFCSYFYNIHFNTMLLVYTVIMSIINICIIIYYTTLIKEKK